MRRLYFDNAATSFPKPPGVYEAMARYGLEVGASPGRGQYREAREGAMVLAEARALLAEILGLPDPRYVVFTLNTSDALNLAIKGVVRAAMHEPGPAVGRGDVARYVAAAAGDTPRGLGFGPADGSAAPVHAITTRMDHNSVLRPFAALREAGLLRWTCVEADATTGEIDPSDIERAIEPTTALVAVSMASNVSGALQPIESIATLCRSRDIPLLVDAAQAAGHVPIDMARQGIDLLAVPGHKGLLGPQGTGALLVHPRVAGRVATSREGGTGSVSEQDTQPSTWPERLEAGSHNTVGIAGWLVALRWIRQRTVHAIREHERVLGTRLLGGLGELGALGLRTLGPSSMDRRVGVFSVIHPRIGPAELAHELESEFGVLARAGIHCAPRAHRLMGTLDDPSRVGAVRLSLGPFLGEDDVDHALHALRSIVGSITLGRAMA